MSKELNSTIDARSSSSCVDAHALEPVAGSVSEVLATQSSLKVGAYFLHPTRCRGRGRARLDRDLQRVNGELRVALAAEEKNKRAMEDLVLVLKEVKAELHTTRAYFLHPTRCRGRGRARLDRDLQRVNGELRVALAAEEKNKRAMEDLVLVLKEVKAELHTTRNLLARAQHESETARLESYQLHVSLKRKDDKVRALSDEVARLCTDAEEAFATFWGKEARFTAWMKSSEVEPATSRCENARLLESQRSGRHEVAKLRDILKQAVKDTKFVKEASEEARRENTMLKEMVGSKDTAVKCNKEKLECLRVSEAAARDNVKELQSLLVATSVSPTPTPSAVAGAGRSFDLEDLSSLSPRAPTDGIDEIAVE
ncbi:myosin-4-like [Triticum urartu]|uniref:myosin-4-like n=1 Tax=Triticum urartu TaxID=4572 RepID=UPI0020445CC8|nr:myosin-4-like [Triticum urartu]